MTSVRASLGSNERAVLRICVEYLGHLSDGIELRLQLQLNISSRRHRYPVQVNLSISLLTTTPTVGFNAV
jgi:hypothetical protein